MVERKAKLGDLAGLVGGRLIGDPAIEVGSVGPIDAAQPGQIAFLFNKKFLDRVAVCQASALIVPPGVDLCGKSGIVAENPYLAFAKVLTLLTSETSPPGGIREGSSVAETAFIADGVVVSAGCRIGDNVEIGRGTILHPNVVLYPML